MDDVCEMVSAGRVVWASDQVRTKSGWVGVLMVYPDIDMEMFWADPNWQLEVMFEGDTDLTTASWLQVYEAKLYANGSQRLLSDVETERLMDCPAMVDVVTDLWDSLSTRPIYIN